MEVKTKAPQAVKKLNKDRDAAGEDAVAAPEISCDVEAGGNLEGAVNTHGQDSVYACYVYGLRVGAQQFARRILENAIANGCAENSFDNLGDLDDAQRDELFAAAVAEATEAMTTWKPGTKLPGSRGKSSEDKILGEFDKCTSVEDQEALLAKIQASIAAKKAGQ